MLFTIEARHFYVGVWIENGIVQEAPPIVRYMVGWPQTKVLNYCRVKRWKLNGKMVG